MKDLLPALSLTEDQLREDGTLDPAALFPPHKECWLEIGFGAGEHLAELIRRHPENAYLGRRALRQWYGRLP